ncbi:hypothetical protein AAFF_G00236790 [Aldrovandia affinis]|uniref:Uncharacterized protein n=1 Tax=Aldrovandia affinis TaxID=143900 RepID=A0AAD7RED6_9TELE|nr:hypothetical protein AAFF_G00236790 [Aldrovandia affinis]
MRYGHSAGGIIGITLKPEALKIWALSRHICCKIESDMKEMEEVETNTTKVNLYHKEEAKARVIADAKDRDGLRQKLDTCLHPLDPNKHPGESIVNITTKSTLKKSLQIEVSRRNAGDADVTVIDGSALLWTIHWPADGTVADFIENVKTRLTSYLSESDVYLIFDRYYDYSIKSVTRDVRETGVNKKHQLLLSTKLPAQKVVLSSIENKKQLNLLLCEELTQDRLFHLRSINKHKLVVTGEDPCPIEIKMEERRTRYDLENQQEEADTIIVQQVLGCAEKPIKSLWFLMTQTCSSYSFTITIRQDWMYHSSWNPPTREEQ